MLKVLLVVALIGITIYLVIRLAQRRGEGGGGGFGRRPVAPDDDPRFLRDLDTQLWEQQQRERSEQKEPDEQP
jgi:hypothetical protein